MSRLENRTNIMNKINERMEKGYSGMVVKSDELFVSTIKYLAFAGYLVELFSKKTNTYIIKW